MKVRRSSYFVLVQCSSFTFLCGFFLLFPFRILEWDIMRLILNSTFLSPNSLPVALSSSLEAAATVSSPSLPSSKDATPPAAAAAAVYENVPPSYRDVLEADAAAAASAADRDCNSDGTLTNDSSPNSKTPSANEEGKQVCV